MNKRQVITSIRNVCVFSGLTWKPTACRRVAEREPEGRARKQALTEAKKAVRDSMKITKSYLNDRPHALRECALVAALAGQEAKSRKYFDECLRVAEEHQARYDRAKTLLARAESGIKFGWADVEQQSLEARAQLNDIEEALNTDQ